MTVPAPASRTPRPSLLGAHVSGFAAAFVLLALRRSGSGEELLRALEADIAAGRREPRHLAEVRETWRAIAEAADAYLTWETAGTRPRICGPGAQEPESLMTVKEAAACLGLSERRVRQLLADGRLQGMRDGRGWRVDRLTVELRKAAQYALQRGVPAPGAVAGQRGLSGAAGRV